MKRIFKVMCSANYSFLISAKDLSEVAGFSKRYCLGAIKIEEIPSNFFVDLRTELVEADGKTMTMDEWRKATDGE
jgi:hypothetical protein